MTDTSH